MALALDSINWKVSVYPHMCLHMYVCVWTLTHRKKSSYILKQELNGNSPVPPHLIHGSQAPQLLCHLSSREGSTRMAAPHQHAKKSAELGPLCDLPFLTHPGPGPGAGAAQQDYEVTKSGIGETMSETFLRHRKGVTQPHWRGGRLCSAYHAGTNGNWTPGFRTGSSAERKAAQSKKY